jgi:hypothetical protein
MGLGSEIRSGKNLFRIPDPGVKNAPDTGSGSATLIRYILQIWNCRNRNFFYFGGTGTGMPFGSSSGTGIWFRNQPKKSNTKAIKASQTREADFLEINAASCIKKGAILYKFLCEIIAKYGLEAGTQTGAGTGTKFI